MWKISRQLTNHLRYRIVHSSNKIENNSHWQLRLYATPVRSSSSGGVGKFVFGFFGASLLTSGGIIAYAKFDRGFRSWLENTIPFSDWALTFIIGPSEEKTLKLPASSTTTGPVIIQQSSKEKAVQSGLVQKKLERDAAKKQESQSTNPPIPSSSQKLPTQENIEKTTTDVPVLATTPTQSPGKSNTVSDISDTKLQQRIISKDATAAAENEALEVLVKESTKSLQDSLTSAIQSYEKATSAIKEHNTLVWKTLEHPQHEGQADDVIKNSSSVKMSALSEAEANSVKARDAIQRVKNVIQHGTASKLTSSNEVLISARESVSDAIYKLQKAESEVIESNVFDEYKNLVGKAQEQFQKELQSIVPDVKVGERGKKLSEEELNFIITYAHRRVQQLETQQAEEQHRVRRALEVQREELDKVANNRVNIELQRQHRSLEIDYHKKLHELNEEFEEELLQQLRRQAAAHSEHLKDVLQAQHKQLDQEHQRRLDDYVVEARHEFQRELANSLGRLKGIEAGLQVRADLDVASKKAQNLWVACQALKHSIHKGQANAKSWEEQRKPLSNEVSAISKAAGSADKYIEVVLSAVPNVALNEGVFTEDALKDRFFGVDTACRRVAMVGEQGGSLIRYALSYLQSLFVVSGGQLMAEIELQDEPVDIDSLNTFDVLDRARWHIDRDNLEQALRYMNLLQGAPRFVASDWIKETRLLLEVRQATDALLARAATSEVQAITG